MKIVVSAKRRRTYWERPLCGQCPLPVGAQDKVCIHWAPEVLAGTIFISSGYHLGQKSLNAKSMRLQASVFPEDDGFA